MKGVRRPILRYHGGKWNHFPSRVHHPELAVFH